MFMQSPSESRIGTFSNQHTRKSWKKIRKGCEGTLYRPRQDTLENPESGQSSLRTIQQGGQGGTKDATDWTSRVQLTNRIFPLANI